jgi:hypothetical protein
MSELRDISAESPITHKKASSAGCFTIALLIGGIIVVSILVCGGIPILFSSLVVERTAPVPGDASNFDPIAHFDAIQQYGGENLKIVSINAWYVRSDGTLDLYADYNPYVEVVFYRELAQPPADAPPVGAGGSPDDRWYEKVEVKLRRPGQLWTVTSGGNSYQYVNLGMEQDVSRPTTHTPGEATSKPICSFKTLWDAALKQDAPTSAVATIRYNANGYEFSIRDTNIRLNFNWECQVVR